jgi:DNA-binding FadR family transcriptional regulator
MLSIMGILDVRQGDGTFVKSLMPRVIHETAAADAVTE